MFKNSNSNSNQQSLIKTYLSGNQIVNASKIATELNLHRLSLMIVKKN